MDKNFFGYNSNTTVPSNTVNGFSPVGVSPLSPMGGNTVNNNNTNYNVASSKVVDPSTRVFELRPLVVCVKCIPIGLTDGTGLNFKRDSKFVSLNLLYLVSLFDDGMILQMSDGNRYVLDAESFNIVKATLYPDDDFSDGKLVET